MDNQNHKLKEALANPFFNFKQAIEYLGYIPESTLREWTSTRKITSYRPGKQVRYRKSDLDEFMKRHIKKSYHMIQEEFLSSHQTQLSNL